MTRTVLITGCSSGFGRLAVETFNSNGWNVMATMRRPEKETELEKLPNVTLTRLDVTDPASIQVAVDETARIFGAIDCLVNNAGYGGHALFEQFGDDAMRAMFETNVFGPVNTMRAVLPLMRKQGRGTIINVSSMAGLLGLPGSSFYSASKFALNGLTEALALEYKAFGIDVHIVEPGAYPTTRFGANTDNHLETGDRQLIDTSKRLRSHIEALGQQMAERGGKLADPQEVADAIFACAQNSKMPVHNPTGSDAEMLVGMIQTAPSRQDFLDQMSGLLLPRDQSASVSS